ncbi:MAG: alpha/beta hydrolase [Chloroflexi bacterium]|nr:alpha/beta hydrolase [Chloroflexota bacterium]
MSIASLPLPGDERAASAEESTPETQADALISAARSFNLAFEDTAPPADGFLDANGLRMHYLDWGGDDKPPILFLHGGRQTAHTWDFTCLQLRHRYRCYALDQRGHGDSDGGPSLAGPYEQREDIRAAVKALGLDPFVLVGMSMGGMNTMAYAAEYVDSLKGAVIVDVSPSVREEGTRAISQFARDAQGFDSLDEAVEQAHRFNPLRPKEHLRYSLLHNLRHDTDGRWRWKYDRGGGPPDLESDEAKAERRALQERLWADVPRITCPVLTVHGGESKVQTYDDVAKLRDTLPDALMVSIPGASHTVQGDRPREFAYALLSFLEEIGYGE